MKKRNLKKPIITTLEQRILFDGAAVATAVDVLDNSSFSSNESSSSTSNNDATLNSAENSVHDAQAVQGFERDRREVAFVDVTVKDYQTLVDGVEKGTEVYLVNSLDEIKTTLSSQTNIDAIHILSHGNTGEITVGNDVLNSNTLDDNAQLLEIMKNSLSVDGDILLYGCNVASDGTGQEFINSIATLTQADVAASDDTTGNSALGGDWELEKSSGSIESDDFEVLAYDSTLLAVSFTGDSGNTNSPDATFNNSTPRSSISITNTATNDTLIISTTGTNYYQDTATTFSNLGITPLSGGTGMLFYADIDTDFTNSITFTIQGNKVFDFNKILLQEINDAIDTFTFTPNGDVSKRVTFSFNNTETKLIDLSSNTNFDGITSLTISTLDNQFQASFDNIEVENIRSASDTTPPTFDVAPATSNITATTLDLSASLDEAGKIYYVVVADGATAPTIAQIKAGQDSSGASALKSGNSDVTTTPFTGTYNITGLSANTAYDIYVVGQDDEGTPNVMASATKVDVTTTTLNITFDFESNVTGFDTTDVRQTVSNETLKVISSTSHMDGAIKTGGTQLSGNESLFTASNYINEISTTFSLVSGKTFDLTSLKLKDNLATQETVTITSSKGSATFSINASTLKFFDSSIAGFSNLQGVSSFTVTVANAGNPDDGYGIIFDDIYLTNILDITGPTVSVATVSYTDTAVNDTFTNTTGTISATASSGSIIGYGISGGTTSGNTDVGGTIYDVSKAGTYGTLYVKSSDGSYVYVPISNSVINATTSTVTDTFTIQATDGSGTTGNSLTITINGVNDAPVLTAPTSASYTDTSATDTFSNTTGTLSASDRDTGATLSYGISSGTTAGSTLIGGVTYDVSKAGTYGTLYVVSTGADKGKYVYVPTANVINALTANVTDTFTVSSSDGSLSNTQTLTVNITGVNDTPTTADKTITINEDTATLLSVSDFGFSDIDTGSALSSVKITSLASDGTLEYNNGTSWVAVTLNQEISVADITGNKLRFSPSLNENGVTYSTFNFTVNDGTVDSSAKTITYNVTAVNDTPTVSNAIVDQSASVSNVFNFVIPVNSFTDVDTSDTLTYTAQLVDSSGNLVSGGTLPSWLIFNAGTRTFSGTPALSDTGTIYVKVTATDNGTGTLSVSDTFTITTNSGPTVSVATGTYNDTVANDTFTNTTGTISAIASSGSITGYGISGGTTGGSTDVGGTIYDVSKAGTYGTLYVKSSNGNYVYVPTSNSVINATTSTVTDVFTIQATDGSGTTGNSLTITINGVNDTPVLSAPTSASYTDTSATDTFSNTTGTLSASDRDTGATLSYGINTGTTGGSTLIGGITYDVSKTGTYGTLYVVSTGADKGKYAYVPTANVINALTSNATDTFTVSSSDGSLSNTQTFTVNITGVNDTPTAADKTITINEDTPTLLSVSDFGFSDVDTGSALSSVKITSLASDGILEYNNGTSWVAVTLNQEIAVADITGNKLRFNPSLNENGTTYATFNFTVNDGTIDSSAKTVTYNVTAVNDTPTVANTITDQNASVSNTFSFVVPLNTFADVDTSDTFTYTAQLVDSSGNLVSGGTLPSWLTFTAGTRTFSGTPALSDTGTIYVKVTATDNGTGTLSVSDTFTITTNSGPTVSVATVSYTDTAVNDTFTNTTGTISATASSGSITGYGISGGTTGGSTDVGGTIYDVSKAGTYGTLYVKSSDGSYVYVPISNSVINATTSTVTDTFTIQATDGSGTTGNSLTITINGVNDTPIVSNSIVDQTATEDSVYNYQFTSNVFTDVDAADTLTYTAQLVDSNGNLVNSGTLPTWLIFNAGTRTFSGTPANSDVGIIYLKVTATDGTSATTSDIFALTVNNVNDVPVGSVTISGTVTQGETLTASNNITDADGLGTITYQWYADGVLINGATNSTYVLTQNEVNKEITVLASYTDGFGTTETVTSITTIKVANVNDAPTVSLENINSQLSFGDNYTKDISVLFNDIDFDNVFTYEATNLPQGLTIDPSTGVISGKANQSGEFVITIKVTDNGMPALSVSRTYNMLVIAPSQVEIPPVTPITTPINNTPISIAEIGITTFADTVSLGTINNNPFKEASDSIGIGFLNNSVTSTQEKTNTQTNNSDNQVQTVSTNRNNNGNYIEADASINVNSNGQVTFDKATQDSFSVVGIAIEDMKIENNRLEIKVVDTSVAKNFVVTKADGTALPAGISFDPKTGNISGTVPENLDKLDISIKAINADGTTRVLNIKVDLKKLKEASRADADNYIGLKEQLVAENQKLENYGDYLVSLFA